MNDRAIKARRDFRRSLVQPPAYSWTSSEIWSCCSRALYSLVLITSRGTDSTISLSTLFHCSTGFMINLFSVCLLYPVWVAPWSLSFFAHCLSAFHYAQLTTQLWRAWHCHLTKVIVFSLPCRPWQAAARPPGAFSSSCVRPVLSAPPHRANVQPASILLAFYWAHFNLSISFS